ncbi:hypothetical protein [uncultured Alistipes sp.]|uniref:hypothetical protein n=1 Tax=uncultured Alistipes sp. TaxID=538949 RepID=UPI00272AA439|nr:hypothetical protein [uncultured Alistipes sp.]
MKKYVLFVLALIALRTVSAQNYYQDGVPVTADGITFNVEISKYIWSLSNIENTRTDVVNWRYKSDGREIGPEEFNRIEFELYDVNRVAKVFKDTFTPMEIAALKRVEGSPMNVYYVFGPDGNILEVAFTMSVLPEVLSIPPVRFAQLEKNLKKHVRAYLNPFAQQMEFVGAGQIVGFRFIDEQAAAAGLPQGSDKPVDPLLPEGDGRQ